jgi:hypothetical protein
LLRRDAPRNDGETQLAMTARHNDAGHGFAVSPRVFARVLPEMCRSLNSEGAGNAGRLMRPQPRVQSRKHTSSHHGHTGITRHSPRNGFTAYFVLSPAIGLFCHRHRRK